MAGHKREWEGDMAFLVAQYRREQAAAPSGANAPYKIRKSGEAWQVVNNTGEVKATFDSHDKALKYLRALYVNVPGAAKRAKKVGFTGKARQRIPK